MTPASVGERSERPEVTAQTLLSEPPILGRQALAARFVDLVPLLAETGDEEVLRTGASLRHLKLADLESTVPTARLTVIGDSTIAPLQAPLLGALAARGIAGTVTTGDFDRMIPELLEPESSIPPDATAVVLLPDGESVFRSAPVPFTADSAADAINRSVDQLLAAIDSFRNRSPIPVIVPTLLLPAQRSQLLVDLPSRARLSAAWHRANARILDAAETIPGFFGIDMGQIAANAPDAATDLRLAAYAKAFFSESVMLGYARQVAAVVAAQLGRTSKCLILDLDGTTWGGVLADDGPLGVISGDGRVGEAYAWVQDAARQLSAQGVVLAISSKNDHDSVTAALSRHPGLRIREGDFALVAANWDPKPGNIDSIARTLNIGHDALVFVDDNQSERGAVRVQYPQVRTIAAATNDPSLTVPALLRDGAFTSLRTTDDDLQRPQRYRAEVERVTFRQSASSVQDYLAGLATVVSISPARESDIDRLSQLTLRTNQFNLTTQRLDPDAVRAFANRPDTVVSTVHCADRFGDHGLVGGLFAEFSERATLRIVNFVMSCRVLGRGVESAVLRESLLEAVARGATDAVGTYIRTAKNGRAVEFFSRLGFSQVGEDATDAVGGITQFRRDLETVPDPIPHVSVDVTKETK